MFGDTLRNQSLRVLFGETSEDRFAVGRAVKRESFSDRRQREEALLTRNLVDKHGRAARQNRKINGFADVVA